MEPEVQIQKANPLLCANENPQMSVHPALESCSPIVIFLPSHPFFSGS